MEQSSKNENTCEVFMNEVRIKDEVSLKREKMVSLQSNKRKQEVKNEQFFKKEITCTKYILEKK
jgi:hypothetical protein